MERPEGKDFIKLFGSHQVYHMNPPTNQELANFWEQLRKQVHVCYLEKGSLMPQLPVPIVRKRDSLPELPLAPGQEAAAAGLSRAEEDRQREHDDYCMVKLREIIRNILFSLGKNPRYKIFFSCPDESTSLSIFFC
jgi:hypothetical protein